MTDTFVWRIDDLESKIPEGDVTKVDYSFVAKRIDEDLDEHEYIAGTYDRIYLKADSSSEDYIKYDDLTEEICIGWVVNYLGEEVVAELQAKLVSKLDEQQNPTKLNHMPWVKPEEGIAEDEEVVVENEDEDVEA